MYSIYMCHTHTCVGGVYGSNDGLFRVLQLLKAAATDTSVAQWSGQ